MAEGRSEAAQGDGRARVAYFVPPSRHFAGIERVVHEVATGLAEEHGHELDVHVVYARGYDEESLRATAYRKHVLGVERLRGLALAIRRCVARQRFDVLICPQVEPSVLTWFATRGLGLPVFLVHLHGNPMVEERRGSRSTKAAFVLFRRLVARRISGVLVVSPSLQRYVSRSLTPRLPVVYVPNPVREFPHANRGVAEDAYRFVSVARLSHQKGQDVLLRALAVARPRLPRCRLTLVGSGPDESKLRSLARELGLEDVVHFAGYTSDPAPYLADADCFVLASRWEGFGVALIEALRFGLPLLATKCEFGPADIITDPSIGELVETDNAVSLAEGLVRAVARCDGPQDVARRREVASRYSRSVALAEHAAVLTRFTTRVAAH